MVALNSFTSPTRRASAAGEVRADAGGPAVHRAAAACRASCGGAMASATGLKSLDVDSDEEDGLMPERGRKMGSPKSKPLCTFLREEMRELVCSNSESASSFIMFLLLLLAALLVIGRMVYRDLSRDWVPCSEEESEHGLNVAKHFYCVNISQVHNVLAVSKKPFKPK